MSALMVSSPASLTLQLQPRLLSGPQLVSDYLAGAPVLAPLFAGYPWDTRSIERVAQAIRKSFPSTTRRAMPDALRATTDVARAKLESIAAGDGFFVATGQQAGLFGGPLFTVYKVLTAIRFAELLEDKLSVPVAALFWIAADDHDFAEVNHTYVFGVDNELKRIEIAGGNESTQSMNRRLLDDSATEAVAALRTSLPANEFSEELLGWIAQAYVPGNTMAGAFEQLIALMFAQHDLVITSSAHPVVKSLAAPVILRELEQAEAHEQIVRSQTDRLISAAYHEQVSVRAGAANVLYEDDDGRDRLVREDGNWHLARTKRRVDKDELHELLALQPERFSPNVLLRPVVASAVFPTIAYVGGPAELSYFAQIGCLFQAHDVIMPLVLPRASMDVVEQKVQKVLDKFRLDSAHFRQPLEQLASQVARNELPATISASISELSAHLTAGYASLVAEADGIDPTLRGPLEAARTASEKLLQDSEKKIISHLKKRNEIGLEQLRKASANLYPDNQPQERVVNAISYLARYGHEFLNVAKANIAISLDAQAPDWQGVSCT